MRLAHRPELARPGPKPASSAASAAHLRPLGARSTRQSLSNQGASKGRQCPRAFRAAHGTGTMGMYSVPGLRGPCISRGQLAAPGEVSGCASGSPILSPAPAPPQPLIPAVLTSLPTLLHTLAPPGLILNSACKRPSRVSWGSPCTGPGLQAVASSPPGPALPVGPRPDHQPSSRPQAWTVEVPVAFKDQLRHVPLGGIGRCIRGLWSPVPPVA